MTPAWPAQGQAAVAGPNFGLATSPAADVPVPIASVAKIMSAYVILRDHPMPVGGSGFSVVVTAADVADRQQRQAAGQSTVAVAAGEILTEDQLLEGFLSRPATTSPTSWLTPTREEWPHSWPA